MKMKTHLLIGAILGLVASASPNPDEKRPLADVEHFTNPHHNPHNPQYDHEAFLGEDQAKTFDQLPPEESRRRLGIIVDKIDDNKDGFVQMDELKNWISYTQNRYIEDDVERHWRDVNGTKDAVISWEV